MNPSKFITFALFISLSFGCTHTYVATFTPGESVLPKIPENASRIVIYRPMDMDISVSMFLSPAIIIDTEEKKTMLQGQYAYYNVEPGKHLIEVSGESFSLEINSGETIFIKVVNIQTGFIYGTTPISGHYEKLTATQVHHTQGALEIVNLTEAH